MWALKEKTSVQNQEEAGEKIGQKEMSCEVSYITKGWLKPVKVLGENKHLSKGKV